MMGGQTPNLLNPISKPTTTNLGKKGFGTNLYKPKEIDLTVSKDDLKDFKSMFEKAEKLTKRYKGDELGDKLLLLSRVYQRMKKNAIDPKDNFFMSYKEKYNQ